MKVLFIPLPTITEPWYGDFLTAIDGKCEVDLYDPLRPFDEQLIGVDFVAELGGVVATRPMIDAAASRGVRLWQILGTGMDHVDVEYFQSRNLPLANTPGQFSAIALAEHALFLMLCFAKRYRDGQRNIGAGVFNLPVSDELSGRVLGIVGLGASGKQLAGRASAFGMRVSAIDTAVVPDNTLRSLGVESFAGLDGLNGLLKQADYVSLHVPLSTSTRHMIDAARLGVMKTTAVLINVARGGLVDEPALISALTDGRIRGAGLDTFSREPLPNDHPLLALENVIATPHVAGVSDGTSRRRGAAAAENILRVAGGEPPLYTVTSRG